MPQQPQRPLGLWWLSWHCGPVAAAVPFEAQTASKRPANADFLMFKAPKQLPKNAVIYGLYGLAGKWIAFKRNSTGNIKFLSSTIAGLSPISLNQCWEWCTVHQPRWSPTQHLCHVIDFIRVTRTDDRCHLLPPSRNRGDDVGTYGFKCVINKSNTCRLYYPFNMLFGILLWGKGFTE